VGTGLSAVVVICVVHLWLAPESRLYGTYAGQQVCNRTNEITLTIGFTVLAVEALYFVAPNVKQRFLATLPGAILSVSFWIGLSYLLGIYFRTFAHFSKTYGTLGAGIALMVWLYWTGFAMLVGAELNAELAKRTKEGPVQQKNEDPPAPMTLIA
jgi:YihY family inner membrane protein